MSKIDGINIEEIKKFMEGQPETTKVYLGCDSERFKLTMPDGSRVWHADYILVVVIHIAGSKGAKIFGEVQRERDIDSNKSKPFNRMMTEATKVCELYNKLKDVFYDFEVEIHLDINPNEKHGSSVAYNAAVGYVKAMTNVIPMAKPQAWAASYAADRSKELGHAKLVQVA